MMLESFSMMISLCALMCRSIGDDLPPGFGARTFLSGSVTARRAEYRGSHLGPLNAAPAVIGARVPEAYVAIMD